jgi:regulatory protein
MVAKIRSSALRLLAQREHTKYELRRKLVAKGYAAELVDQVITDLERQGLQSDQRFVESYIKMRCRRDFGPIRIRMELSDRGVDPELIERSLVKSNIVWLEAAKKAKDKKFGKAMPKDLQQQAKQMRYLYYKGFPADLIRSIFNTNFSAACCGDNKAMGDYQGGEAQLSTLGEVKKLNSED